MSTRSSLRRSRRAPKRISDYNAGDVVEIDRSGVTLKARLAQLLTEGTSPNPRWLIKFDGQPYKDEEVYEHTFGKLLIAADDEPESLPIEPIIPRRQNSNIAKSTSTSSSSTSTSTDLDKKIPATTKTDEAVSVAEQGLPAEDADAKDAASDDKKDKKSVTFSNENSPIGSDESTTQETGTEGGDVISSREARSLRRQTMIDESDGVLAWTGGSNLTATGKRRLPAGGSGSSKNGSKSKRPRQDGDDSVVKVKLLTGTLYLYRGRNRRAEFIRRV